MPSIRLQEWLRLAESREPLLWPERRRCLACDKWLGSLRVIRRVYCSYECAHERGGMMLPWKRPGPIPRMHTLRGGNLPKRPFTYPEEPLLTPGVFPATRDPDRYSIYYCAYCGMWHIGHKSRKIFYEETQ